jgi:hypothetical protein
VKITREKIPPSSKFKPYNLVIEIPDQATAYRLYNACDAMINKSRSEINLVEAALIKELWAAIDLQNGDH